MYLALQSLRRGGQLTINAIHTSMVPSMTYETIYYEKVIKTVTNATRQDAKEFFDLAYKIPIESFPKIYPLEKANEALLDLKNSKFCGTAVFLP